MSKALILAIVFVAIAVILNAGYQYRKPAENKKTADSSVFQSANGKAYNAGLKIFDFPYVNSKGNRENITNAVWYPTEEKAKPYTYETSQSYKGSVAFNAATIAKGGPYPLVIYVHGGFASGYSAAYFGEHLARAGYIVAAPDFIDTLPPSYTEPIAFSTIKGGKESSMMEVFAAAKQWIADMNNDREFFLAYLAEHRLNHFSFVIDKMIEENRKSGALFYGAINESAIGAFGHSEGGITVLGKIGAHPTSAFRDSRVKAALIFSAPAAPFEQTLNQIAVPIMVMVGDDDRAALGPDLPRRIIYNEASTPKYHIVVKDADHFTFGNPSRLSVFKGGGKKTESIKRYGTAFFNVYLKNDAASENALQKTDPAWAYYIKEEKLGDIKEWGVEPEQPSANEPPLGIGGGEARNSIRERIMKRILEKFKR
ncbi:MAG: hypothetical protein A3C00_01370 [Candidatus Jacksonbacteria bacterium RIFCSPHIGHO2_02_FULL_44_25]|nr:MAG: hypothetical protein A3C00_01370 [Candidatus Jacksonbacteria bacterium RIFCSPHIGHO2_02_FULL_44_25]